MACGISDIKLLLALFLPYLFNQHTILTLDCCVIVLKQTKLRLRNSPFLLTPIWSFSVKNIRLFNYLFLVRFYSISNFASHF